MQLSELEKSSKEWPKSASVLGKRLVRAKLFLQAKGINIDPYREGRERTITFRKLT